MVACDGRVTPTGGAHQEVTSWREERGRVGVMVRESGGDGEGVGVLTRKSGGDSERKWG